MAIHDPALTYYCGVGVGGRKQIHILDFGVIDISGSEVDDEYSYEHILYFATRGAIVDKL